MSEINEAVRSHYATAAKKLAVRQPCRKGSPRNLGEASDFVGNSDGDCCGGTYDAQELEKIGMNEAVSLGCGNPTILAELRPGEVVLDLGSGVGLDVLLSARRVLPGGHAYGVDMTDEMLELANQNREKSGVTNATFLKGRIESVPLPDASVDVVISNCVINLAEDKSAVIQEAHRLLRPGGRLAVADMVELEPLIPAIKKHLDAWAGCIAGTIPIDRYRSILEAAGFVQIAFQVHSTQGLPGIGKVGSAYIRARKP